MLRHGSVGCPSMVIVFVLTTTDTDSLSSRLSSCAPSILIASRTVSWLRPFLDEDPFGLFAAAVRPLRFLPAIGYALLACRWHCSFTSCRSALLFPAVGLALFRFLSTIRLVDLVLKVSVLVASRDFALRAVPRVLLRTLLTCCFSAGTFTCCAWITRSRRHPAPFLLWA